MPDYPVTIEERAAFLNRKLTLYVTREFIDLKILLEPLPPTPEALMSCYTHAVELLYANFSGLWPSRDDFLAWAKDIEDHIMHGGLEQNKFIKQFRASYDLF